MYYLLHNCNVKFIRLLITNENRRMAVARVLHDLAVVLSKWMSRGLIERLEKAKSAGSKPYSRHPSNLKSSDGHINNTENSWRSKKKERKMYITHIYLREREREREREKRMIKVETVIARCANQFYLLLHDKICEQPTRERAQY